MTRAVYRFRNYRIEPDHSDDAEPIVYFVQCAACEATGPLEDGSDDATIWIVAHLKAEPAHVRYREVITRPYRAVALEWL